MLSLAGLAISVWWFPWYYAPRLPVPCGAGLPPSPTGVYNCERFVYIGPWTMLGRPIASFGIGFFFVMLVLAMPPLWRSSFRWVHSVRLIVALTGVALACSVISIVPNYGFRHYVGLPVAVSIVVLLFVLTATTLPRALAEASEGLRSGALREAIAEG